MGLGKDSEEEEDVEEDEEAEEEEDSSLEEEEELDACFFLFFSCFALGADFSFFVEVEAAEGAVADLEGVADLLGFFFSSDSESESDEVLGEPLLEEDEDEDEDDFLVGFLEVAEEAAGLAGSDSESDEDDRDEDDVLEDDALEDDATLMGFLAETVEAETAREDLEAATDFSALALVVDLDLELLEPSTSIFDATGDSLDDDEESDELDEEESELELELDFALFLLFLALCCSSICFKGRA